MTAHVTDYGAVEITGSGFTDAGELELMVLDSDGEPVSGPYSVDVDPDGNLEGMVEAPWQAGTYVVRVSGEFGGSATQVVETTFTVMRREVWFEGTRIQNGVFNLIFRGSGFEAGDEATIEVIGVTGSSSVLAGADGTFVANVPAPQEPGSYEAIVEYPGGGEWFMFEVPEMPVLEANASSDGWYTIHGANFDPYSTLTVYLGGTWLAEVVTDEYGTFGIQGEDGPTTPGTYEVMVLGDFAGASNQSVTFDLTVWGDG